MHRGCEHGGSIRLAGGGVGGGKPVEPSQRGVLLMPETQAGEFDQVEARVTKATETP